MKRKVLFISPPMAMDERYGKRVGEVGGHLAPLGLAYMASVLLEQGHDVEIIDAPALKLTEEDILRRIGRSKPDLIGISSITPSSHCVSELSKRIKEKYPKVTLVIGGPTVTLCPEKTLEDTKADFVVAGDGELAMLDIVTSLETSITTPFPGTELYEMAENFGKIISEFDQYNVWNPVFIPFGYKGEEEIKKIHKEAFRRFYLRPSYILKRLNKSRSLSDLRQNPKGVRMVIGFTQ